MCVWKSFKLQRTESILLIIMAGRFELTEEERKHLKEFREWAKHPKVRKALKEFIKKTTS